MSSISVYGVEIGRPKKTSLHVHSFVSNTKTWVSKLGESSFSLELHTLVKMQGKPMALMCVTATSQYI